MDNEADKIRQQTNKKLREDLSTFLTNEEVLAENLIITARLYATRLDSLVDNGFTREEAISIISARGLV
jgi:hypothetical protein